MLILEVGESFFYSFKNFIEFPLSKFIRYNPLLKLLMEIISLSEAVPFAISAPKCI